MLLRIVKSCFGLEITVLQGKAEIACSSAITLITPRHPHQHPLENHPSQIILSK